MQQTTLSIQVMHTSIATTWPNGGSGNDWGCHDSSVPEFDQEQTETTGPEDAPDAQGTPRVFEDEGSFGGDNRSKLIHSVVATAANMHDSVVQGICCTKLTPGSEGYGLYGARARDSRPDAHVPGEYQAERESALSYPIGTAPRIAPKPGGASKSSMSLAS